jgi:glutathione synthase/RimK-type ligase-like ATP-grasp enzyme
MKTIAFLVTHGYYPSRPDRTEPDYAAEQLAMLAPALKHHGLQLEPVFWQDEGIPWHNYVAVLPLMAWNYPQQVDLFLKRLDEIEAAQIPIFNGADTLRANMDKSYLADLSARGAPVPATISLETCDAQAIIQSFDQLGADEIIIKPRIGAGAWRQARLRRGQEVPASDVLPPKAALIQPFLTSVTREGELSLLYFGGRFSHALMKRPKEGDYRTQGQHGASEVGVTPPDGSLQAAQAVLDLSTSHPLVYARVDMVRGANGAWLLMELELIEPWLYLAYDGHGGRHGATLFASALNGALHAHVG